MLQEIFGKHYHANKNLSIKKFLINFIIIYVLLRFHGSFDGSSENVLSFLISLSTVFASKQNEIFENITLLGCNL